ncbi:MAG TPA: adenosylcobinamide-GDP ribazoletransferase, partial [Ilumatobacteraceae bacterium]|nr:adenosylcobinamide-GDP ribazoletransferase [Ilumatobacteraceae bacterium]
MLTDRTGFFGAVQFLTRVPVRRAAAADTASIVVWFPVVGALVGATAGAVAAGLGELVPTAVGAVVAVLAGVLITG